jgi:hypothetical protein
MKFRTIHGVKTLKFPYLADYALAMTALAAHTAEPAIESLPRDIAGGVLHQSESAPSAVNDRRSN